MLPQKRNDLERIVIDPRLLPERVVAARNHGFAVFDFVFAQGIDRIAGEVGPGS